LLPGAWSWPTGSGRGRLAVEESQLVVDGVRLDGTLLLLVRLLLLLLGRQIPQHPIDGRNLQQSKVLALIPACIFGISQQTRRRRKELRVRYKTSGLGWPAKVANIFEMKKSDRRAHNRRT
jgi:hypothetical protein